MILYLGSSSLIKLYIDEPFSDIVADWVAASEIVATCRVAYAEIVSALDIRLKRGDLSSENHGKVLEKFNEDWPSIAKVDFTDFEAGDLIRKYGLTRFGALHLAAAKRILYEYNQSVVAKRADDDHAGLVLFFSSFDEALCKAATVEGLKVLSSIL